MIVRSLQYLKGKNVKVETVSFSEHDFLYDEGIVDDVITEGGGGGSCFIVLDTGVMVNCRYIRRMEIVE